MWYLICAMVGVCVGIFLMSLMTIAAEKNPMPRCTGNCNQGRSCTCGPK